MQSIDVDSLMEKCKETLLQEESSVLLKTVDYAIFPRLEWSDRYLDMMM